jgi:hypothetical protein
MSGGRVCGHSRPQRDLHQAVVASARDLRTQLQALAHMAHTHPLDPSDVDAVSAAPFRAAGLVTPGVARPQHSRGSGGID